MLERKSYIFETTEPSKANLGLEIQVVYTYELLL